MIRILVPATSANLGSGFDSLGVALAFYNYVSMCEWDTIDIRSLDQVSVPVGERNLIYRSAKMLYELCGKKLGGLKLEQTNNIPMARGLGSSSACITAGLVGANHMLGNPLSKKELVEYATSLEGHPDNVAPAILGGLVTSVYESGKIHYVKQNLDDSLNFVAIVPDFELSTELARSVLPSSVSLEDAVYNLSRSALMAVSLGTGRYQNLRVAAGDRLHQKYRLQLMENAEDIYEYAYEAGAYCVYISGAGSTLMAISDDKNPDFTDRLRTKLDDYGLIGWQIKSFKADNQGANVIPAD